MSVEGIKPTTLIAVLGLLMPLITSLGVAFVMFGGMQNQIEDLEEDIRAHEDWDQLVPFYLERLASVEAHSDDLERRVTRLEAQLDALIRMQQRATQNNSLGRYNDGPQ